MKLRYPLAIIIIGLATFFLWPYFQRDAEPKQVELSKSVESILVDRDNRQEESIIEEGDLIIEGDFENEELPKSESTVLIPPEVLVKVPFIVQAPFADWEFPYKEACEEASLMMVHNFFEGKTTLSQEEMKAEIDSIIFWGDDHLSGFDTNVQESSLYFTELLGYNDDRIHIVYDMTIDDMKAILSSGLPIIVPAAGRELGNENFQTPGPLYHMLVIVGYDGDEFITNDPGTRNGEGYRYKEDVLYAAIHDLTDDIENIVEGRKVMIVVDQELG